MSNLYQTTKYDGGLCYALCQELYTFYNPATLHCRKGCDFGMGRVNDPDLKQEAEDMCKQYVADHFIVSQGQLEGIEDLRVHSEMFPVSAENMYRHCLTGIRRQRY